MSKEEKQSIQEQQDDALMQAGMDTFFAETSAARTKPEQKGGMSKNIKGLIAGVAVLVLLGGGLTAALLLGDKDEAGTSSDSTPGAAADATEPTEMISLNESIAEDVTQVDIDAENIFTVYRKAEATETEDAVYSIKGLEDVPLSDSLLSTVVNNASSLSASKLVEENAADLSKYGLADPTAQVTMHYADGAAFSFAVGNATPMDNTMTYCAVDGDVYLVKSSLMANYQKGSDFFVSKTILEEPSEDDYPIVESIRIQRADLDYDIFLEHAYSEEDDSTGGGTAASHVMREPIFSYLDLETSVDVTNGMFGLSAVDITAIHPTDSELEDAGILEPVCTVTMKCDDGKTYCLNFGSTYEREDGTVCYYTYLDGMDVLYGVAEKNAVWATMKPGDITSANIFGTYVWDIATLDVTMGNKQLKFEGEGDKDNYAVTKNGSECDTERFRLFYRFFLNIYGEELCLEETLPSDVPDASVHLVTQDGKEDYTVEFYRMDQLNMLVAVNGQPTYKIRSSCLDAIEHNIDIFDTNEEFTLTWR